MNNVQMRLRETLRRRRVADPEEFQVRYGVPFSTLTPSEALDLLQRESYVEGCLFALGNAAGASGARPRLP